MLMLALVLAAQPLVEPDGVPVAVPVSVEVTQDPITDRVGAFATIRTEEGRLAVGCDPTRFRGVRVQVQSRYWLAHENVVTGVRKFDYRFDATPPRRGRFRTSARTAWLRSREETDYFMSWMRRAERVVIRVRDVEGRRLDLGFPLAEMGPAIDEALRICAGAPGVDS